MQGKTVVVTGGTSGIGEVAALRLAEKGARIVLIARDPARTAATLAKLKNAGTDNRRRMEHMSNLSGPGFRNFSGDLPTRITLRVIVPRGGR